MGDQRDIDPELRGTDRLFAMQALTNERLAQMTDAMRDLKDAVDGRHEKLEQRVDDLANEQAEQRGAMRILRWLVPGGPTLVALVAAIAIYATTR